VLAAAALCVFATNAQAQILPWEVVVAEIEAGRLRGLMTRLAKQNLLYQLHLGEMRKEDMIATAMRIDRVIDSLQQGSPSYSIPAPWTSEIREQLLRVDNTWGTLRKIAVASPYDSLRLKQQFVAPERRGSDPLLIRYFDDVSLRFVAESEELIALYHGECLKTGLEVCATAETTGYGAMVIERAAQEAVYIVAGMDADRHRERLKETIGAYQKLRSANNENPFFAGALDPERSVSARAAGELLVSLRDDWDSMQREFEILGTGDEQNFDLQRMLQTQARLVAKVERLTAALVRYASLTYGT
jgi:hypothetical protein